VIYDEKLAKPTDITALVGGQRRVIHHQVLSPDLITIGPLVTWVTLAAQQGYYADSQTTDKLYYAMAYAQSIVAQAQNGTANISVKVPYWLNCFCAMVKPRGAPIEQGMSVESYILNADYTIPGPSLPIGPDSYGYQWLCYVVGSASGADMFPEAVAPPTYDPAAGAFAFNDISSFMLKSFNNKNHELVTYGSPTPFDNVMSAFAFPINPVGTGFRKQGGLAFEAHLALPINCPKLAVFGTGSASTAFFDATRYPEYVTVSSGDSLSVGQILQQQDVTNLFNKKRTFYKPVDFHKFAEVLARWATGIIQQKFQDTTLAITDPAQFLCPLTLQEVMLVLRNELMVLYSDSQVGVQGIYPALPQTSLDNQFVPFISMPTTCGMAFVAMELPQLVAENAKSLMQRGVGPKNSKDWRWWLPILGQYEFNVLDPLEYTVTFTQNETTTTYPVFAAEPQIMRRRRDPKTGKESFIPEVETPISLVDGSTSTSVLFINDVPRLTALAEKWNTWLAPLKTYSSPLTVITKDLGSNVLCSCATTMLWGIPTAAELKREEEAYDRRMQLDYKIRSPYNGQRQAAVISHAPVLASPWASILDFWILPEIKLQVTNPATLNSVTRVQDFYREGNLITTTATGDNGVLLVDKLTTYAKKMVKARDTPYSELDEFLTEASKKGQAGILSSLAADLLGKAFGPTAGQIAGHIASALPI